ncbi:MAG: alpha/beta fold hydrolase [Gemmataceae bacterium]
MSEPGTSARRERVVYIPGLDGTGRLLFRQPRLHAEYDVRCISHPQDSTHTYADLVANAAKPLEESGGGIVLAESFGGAVALRLALERPELVRRLVLVNTFAWFPRRAYIEPLAWFGPLLPAKRSHSASRSFRSLLFFSPDIAAADRTKWWDLTADVPLSAYGRRFGLIAGLDLRPWLPEIQTPALVIAAPDDRVVPASAGRSLAQRLPNARLLQPRVGHTALIHPRLDLAELLVNNPV